MNRRALLGFGIVAILAGAFLATDARFIIEILRLNVKTAALAQLGRPEERFQYALRHKRLVAERFGHDGYFYRMALILLGNAYEERGEHRKAIAEYTELLGIERRRVGPDARREVAGTLSRLAGFHDTLGDFDRMLTNAIEAVGILDELGNPSPTTLQLNLLRISLAYHRLGRIAEARRWDERARQAVASETPSGAQGKGDAHIDTYFNLLASGKVAEAIVELQAGIALYRAAYGPEHLRLLGPYEFLAQALARQGQAAEAERQFVDNIERHVRIFGEQHLRTAGSIDAYADFLRGIKRHEDVLKLRERSLRALTAALPDGDHNLAAAHFRLSGAYSSYGKPDQALAHARRAVAITRVAVATISVQRSGSDLTREIEDRYRHLLALAAQGYFERQPEAELLEDAFVAAQLMQRTAAAAAMTAMTARAEAGVGGTGDIIRQRQDLLARWQDADVRLFKLTENPQSGRDAQALRQARDDVAGLRASLARIDERIATEFPAYAALANPPPLSVEQARSLLDQDEALVFFYVPQDASGLERAYVWSIGASGAAWARIQLSASELEREVAALRCGLDEDAQTSKCRVLLATDAPVNETAGPFLSFDHGRANRLYAAILEPVARITGSKKHLLLVPSGPLSLLPFQVLVSRPPGPKPSHASARWLIRDHALTVLPSVSSLASTRTRSRRSQAPETFIGFGNPVLKGMPGCQVPQIPDRCPELVAKAEPGLRIAIRTGSQRGLVAPTLRDGVVTVDDVSKLCPLPDTAHELACVARSLGAGEDKLYLGAEMTETHLKQLSLHQYRIVHFATHGLLAAELAKMASGPGEPALVMTPPDDRTSQDDGLLTASEIADLKLDADWVVLSACNTAAGGGRDAQALSGLASAFFYAGARTLLASHWAVNSWAATRLTSTSFGLLAAHPGLSRSEALQRAMLSLLDDSRVPWASHPSVWAPFVIVGDGGAR